MDQMIEKLYIKTNSMCVGDNWHNEYMDILVKDIPDNEANKIIIEYFSKSNWKTGHWVFDFTTKEEMRKLNTIMRTKTKETLRKRIINFINHLMDGDHYSLMLNSKKIEGLSDLLSKFAVKYMEVHNG